VRKYATCQDAQFLSDRYKDMKYLVIPFFSYVDREIGKIGFTGNAIKKDTGI